MGKKFLTVFSLLLMSVAIYAQKGTMTLNGAPAEYNIEKQYGIGPGSVYSQYVFKNIAPYGYKMVVNVIEIDQNNQYVKQAPYLAEGKYNTSNSQVAQHRREQQNGKKPLASVMANPFTQISTGSEYMPDWSVMGGLAIDGAVCHSGSGACYYVDSSNKGFVGNVSMSMSITSNSAGTIAIGNINRVRSNSSTPTLFCNGFHASKDISANANKGKEAMLRLTSGSVVGTGSVTAVVENKMDGSGYSIPAGYAIISGLNGAAYDYVNKLQQGETVTISVSCTDAARGNITLKQLASPLFGYGVVNGVAQPSNQGGYAQCATGVSQDGNKAYWLQMDNIYGRSDASVAILNQFMQQIGIYNAVLMDGGPSAEMQVWGEWVSVNSLEGGFAGRAVPSALMLYSTAPADNNIGNVTFLEKEAVVKINTPYSPTYYAYNRYGDIISVTDANKAAYYLEFEGNCGKVSDDGRSFIATSTGEGTLYACVSGVGRCSQMCVAVSDIVGVKVKPAKFYTSEGRGTQATLYLSYNDGSETALANTDVTWKSSDEWVVKCNNGYITPEQDGEAEITATYDGMSSKCLVEVKNVEEDVIDLTPLINAPGNINIVLDGTPLSVVAVLTPKRNGNAYFEYKNGAGEEDSEFYPGAHKDQDVELVIDFDYNNFKTYPVTISGVNVAGGSNENYLSLKSMKVYYVDRTTGIQSPTENSNTPVAVQRNADGGIKVKVSGDVAAGARCDVYSLDGKLLNTVTSAANEVNVPLNAGSRGAVLVCVTLSGKRYIYKIR